MRTLLLWAVRLGTLINRAPNWTVMVEGSVLSLLALADTKWGFHPAIKSLLLIWGITYFIESILALVAYYYNPHQED